MEIEGIEEITPTRCPICLIPLRKKISRAKIRRRLGNVGFTEEEIDQCIDKLQDRGKLHNANMKSMFGRKERWENLIHQFYSPANDVFFLVHSVKIT